MYALCQMLFSCEFHFLSSVCIVDEATQATEPAALVPILRAAADCIVLAGDAIQLPPTVISKEALEVNHPPCDTGALWGIVHLTLTAVNSFRRKVLKL